MPHKIQIAEALIALHGPEKAVEVARIMVAEIIRERPLATA